MRSATEAVTTKWSWQLALCLSFAFATSVGAQNLVSNSDFSAGEESWNVTRIGGDVAAEFEFTDNPDVCPTEGTPGGCVLVSSSGGGSLTVVWQEITLIGGNQYDVDGQFRMLSEEQEDFWFEFHITRDVPTPGADWIGDNWTEMPFGYASWRDCGADVDGLFSENICAGFGEGELLARPFTARGDAGVEQTYYVGVKGGTNGPSTFAFSLDDITVTPAGGTSTDPVDGIPSSFSIDGVYPNPFNPTTTAVLSIREPGAYTLRLYDLLGRVVQENEVVGTPGRMEVPFDLSGEASGSYLVWVQHQASGHIATAKAMFVK